MHRAVEGAKVRLSDAERERVAFAAVDLDLPITTTFGITVDGGISSSIFHGGSSKLAETGLAAGATGTVVFSTAANANLRTITLPPTSCTTDAHTAAGARPPSSAHRPEQRAVRKDRGRRGAADA